MRVPHVPPPQEIGRADGLAYALFRPDRAPAGGVVVLHGAGSAKESHYDFARMCAASGLAAVVFDQRGHGDSDGPMDARAAQDVATVAQVLPPGPVGLRGSSMGGYFALLAAADAAAPGATGRPVAGVVAICAASADGLARGLAEDRFGFAADGPALTALLAARPAEQAAAALTCPLLLLHAEADESVPVEHSQLLHAAAGGDDGGRSRLVQTPGGHHRSIQHDPELQALSVRFLKRALREA